MAYTPATLTLNSWASPVTIQGTDAISGLDDAVNRIISTDTQSLKNFTNTELAKVPTYLSGECVSVYNEVVAQAQTRLDAATTQATNSANSATASHASELNAATSESNAHAYMLNAEAASLPSQTGNVGKYLTTNGSTPSWSSLMPTISTQAISGISGTIITANGTLSDFTGIDNSTAQVRFSWGTDTGATNGGTTSWVSQSVAGTFSASIYTSLQSTVVYVKAQVQDTNRPSLGVISGSIVSATTGSEVVDSDSYVYLQATGGTGYSALNSTTVPSVTNGSIVSNEVVFSGSGSATTYAIDQQGGQNNFSAITPSFKARPYKLTVDGTSTASVPVVTSIYDNIITTGSNVLFDDGGTMKQVVAGTVTKSSVGTVTITASTETGYAGWYAFDTNKVSTGTTEWQTNVLPCWLKIQNPQAVVVTSYRITGSGNTASPSAWTFEGSNDNSNWTTLDTRSGVAVSGLIQTAGGTTFTLSNTTAYIYYRFNCSAVNGSIWINVPDFNIQSYSTDLVPTLTSSTGTSNLKKYSLASTTPTLTNNPSSAYTSTNSTAIYASATSGGTYTEHTPTLTGFTRATDTFTFSYAKMNLPAGTRSIKQKVSGGISDVISTVGSTTIYS